METIICNFNMFDMTSKVYKSDGKTLAEIGNATFETISPIIVAACSQYAINKVKLFGNGKYLTEIKKDIEEKASSVFEENTIEVEIN